MCGGAKYIEPSGKEWKIYFPSPKAALPVARSDGAEWVKWGRRREEQAPGFIQGEWARIDSIEAGKWDKYSPEFVHLAVQHFMKKGQTPVMDPARPKAAPKKPSFWFDVPAGKAIQALIVRSEEGDARLYVVTEPTPEEYYRIIEHDRWPRIVPLMDREGLAF